MHLVMLAAPSDYQRVLKLLLNIDQEERSRSSSCVRFLRLSPTYPSAQRSDPERYWTLRLSFCWNGASGDSALTADGRGVSGLCSRQTLGRRAPNRGFSLNQRSQTRGPRGPRVVLEDIVSGRGPQQLTRTSKTSTKGTTDPEGMLR